MATALGKVGRQKRRKFLGRQILKREQIFLHPDRIPNDQTQTGRNRSKPAVFRNPVRTTENLAIAQKQIAIVCQGEAGQSKAAAGAKAIRPASEHLLQMAVHEGMFEHVTRAIGNECTVSNCVLTAGILRVRIFGDVERTLALLCAQQVEKFREVVFFPRLSQFLNLLQSEGFQLEFYGVLRRMLHKGVARLEFEISRNVPNPDQRRPAIAVSLTITEDGPN